MLHAVEFLIIIHELVLLTVITDKKIIGSYKIVVNVFVCCTQKHDYIRLKGTSVSCKKIINREIYLSRLRLKLHVTPSVGSIKQYFIKFCEYEQLA